MLTSCPVAGSASAWVSAGTTSSTRPWGRTSVPAGPGRRSRSNCSGGCSQNLLSSSRAASTGLTEPHWCQSRRGPSRFGLVGLAKGLRPRLRLADGFIFFGGGTDHAVDAWDRLRDRVAGLNRSVDDFGGDYVALAWGRHRRVKDGGRCLTRGRRYPRLGGHDGPRPGLHRWPRRLPGVGRRRARLVVTAPGRFTYRSVEPRRCAARGPRGAPSWPPPGAGALSR